MKPGYYWVIEKRLSREQERHLLGWKKRSKLGPRKHEVAHYSGENWTFCGSEFDTSMSKFDEQYDVVEGPLSAPWRQREEGEN